MLTTLSSTYRFLIPFKAIKRLNRLKNSQKSGLQQRRMKSNRILGSLKSILTIDTAIKSKMIRFKIGRLTYNVIEKRLTN